MRTSNKFTPLRQYLLGIGVILALILPTSVLADTSCVAKGEAELDKLKDEYVQEVKNPYVLEQPFGGVSQVASIGEYIQLVYSFALGIVGIIAVVLIMFGGLRWAAAAGNESVISEAKEVIVSAVTGLVIALLSYSILYFINPKTLDTSVSIYVIPKPSVCPTPPPEVDVIEDREGLLGNGKTACHGAVEALYNVVDVMRSGVCETCTIGVGVGYRTTEEQTRLYNCYIAARDELDVTDGSKCTAGCNTCNLAAEPCCSNHEDGAAFDLWLEDVPPDLGAASSEHKSKGSLNNGGAGGNVGSASKCGNAPDPDLCANQFLLRDIMTYTGSGFTSIPGEWWHFDFKGHCKDSALTCTSGAIIEDGVQYAEDWFCQATAPDNSKWYHYAVCENNYVSCEDWGDVIWNTIAVPTCADAAEINSYVEFNDSDTITGQTGIYSAAPGCTDVDTREID